MTQPFSLLRSWNIHEATLSSVKSSERSFSRSIGCVCCVIDVEVDYLVAFTRISFQFRGENNFARPITFTSEPSRLSFFEVTRIGSRWLSFIKYLFTSYDAYRANLIIQSNNHHKLFFWRSCLIDRLIVWWRVFTCGSSVPIAQIKDATFNVFKSNYWTKRHFRVTFVPSHHHEPSGQDVEHEKHFYEQISPPPINRISRRATSTQHKIVLCGCCSDEPFPLRREIALRLAFFDKCSSPWNNEIWTKAVAKRFTENLHWNWISLAFLIIKWQQEVVMTKPC